MGRLVDDAVVVLESIHRHQQHGHVDRRRPRSTAPTPWRCRCSPSTLTTMAVLLPVLLLAGLAKKLFAPLALTVAVAMIASYFVSMLRHAGRVPLLPRPRRARPARRGASSASSIGIADGYARAAARACCRSAGTIVGGVRSCSSSRSVWVADAPAEHVLPRDRRVDGARLRALRAGHVARGRVATKINEMGERSARRAAARATSSWCSPTSARPSNARSAMTSPNCGPAHGLHPPRARRSRAAQADRSARSPTRSRDDPQRATIPGVEFLQWPGGLVASVFSNGYIAPLVVEVRGDNLEELDAQAQRGRRGRAHRRPASATSDPSLQIDYPEVRVETDREKAGTGRRHRARRRADDARGDARQHQHAQRLDRSAATASRTTSSPTTTAQRVDDPNALGADPGARRRRRRGGARSAPTATIRRSVGPDRHRAQPAAARGARADADRGARHRQRRRRARGEAARAIRAPRDIKFELRRPGRADAHDVLGPRPRRSGSR